MDDRMKREKTAVFVNEKIKISVPNSVVSSSEKIPISETTNIDTCRISPISGVSKATIFYLPGTASHDHFPHIINGLCSHIACNLDMQVIPILYRTSNVHLYPTPLIDIERVINFYLEHHEKYNINKEYIFLCGYSAGGLLGILLTILNLGIQGSIPFRGLILLGPVVDLSPFEKAVLDNHKDVNFINRNFLKSMASDFIQVGHNERWPVYSPLHNEPEAIQGFPPILMIYGEHEIFAKGAQILANKIRQSGSLVIEESIEGGTHDFVWVEKNIKIFTDYIKKRFPELLEGYNPKYICKKMHDINSPDLIFFDQHPFLHNSSNQSEHYNHELDKLFSQTQTDLIAVIPTFNNLPSIACNYLHLKHYKYAYRWHLNASSHESLANAFKMLAEKIIPDITVCSEMQSLEIVRHWLQQLNSPHRVLIIYDNLSDPLVLDKFYISNLYHTIIVTSNKFWPEEYYIFSLKQYHQPGEQNLLQYDREQLAQSWAITQKRFLTEKTPLFITEHYRTSIQYNCRKILKEIYNNHRRSDAILGNQGVNLDENCFFVKRHNYYSNNQQEIDKATVDYSLLLQYELDEKRGNIELHSLLGEKNKYIWLTAAVGMGKTTLLKYLCCYQHDFYHDNNHIGIYIPFSLIVQYPIQSGRSDEIYHFIIFCINHIASRFKREYIDMINFQIIKYLISSGHITISLFCDEHDEFIQYLDQEPDAQIRSRKIRLINNLLALQEKSHIAVIIASRELPKNDLRYICNNYINYHLCELDDSRIEHIVNQFFQIPHDSQDNSQHQTVLLLLKTIYNNRALKSICKTPMMLLLICNIVRSNLQNLSMISGNANINSDTAIFNLLSQEMKLRINVDNHLVFSQHLDNRELSEWRNVGNYADRVLDVLQKISLISICHKIKKITYNNLKLFFSHSMQLSANELAEFIIVLKNYGVIRCYYDNDMKIDLIEIAHNWIEQYYAAKEIARCLIENNLLNISFESLNINYTHMEFIVTYKFHESFIFTWPIVIELLEQHDIKSQFCAVNYFWNLFQSVEHDALQIREQYIEFLCLSKIWNINDSKYRKLFKAKLKYFLSLYENENTSFAISPFATSLAKTLVKYQTQYAKYFQKFSTSSIFRDFSDIDLINCFLKISITAHVFFSKENISNLFTVLNELCLRQLEYIITTEKTQIMIDALINLTINYPGTVVPEKIWNIFETFKKTKKMNRGIAQVLIGYLKNCHIKRKSCNNILEKIKQDVEIQSIDGQIVRYAASDSLIEYPSDIELKHFREHTRDWKTDLECQAILYHYSYEEICQQGLKDHLIAYLFLGLGEANWHFRTAALNGLNSKYTSKQFLATFLDYSKEFDSTDRLVDFFPHYKQSPGELGLILISLDKLILNAIKYQNFNLTDDLRMTRQERLFNYLSQQLIKPQSIHRYEDILNCLPENFILKSLVFNLNHLDKKQAIFNTMQHKISLSSIHTLLLELLNVEQLTNHSYLLSWLCSQARLENQAIHASYQSSSYLLLSINSWDDICLHTIKHKSLITLLSQTVNFVMPFSFWTVENIDAYNALSYYESAIQENDTILRLNLEYALLLLFKRENLRALDVLTSLSFKAEDGNILLHFEQKIFNSKLQGLLDSKNTSIYFTLAELSCYAVITCMCHLKIDKYKNKKIAEYIQMLTNGISNSQLLPLALNAIFKTEKTYLCVYSVFNKNMPNDETIKQGVLKTNKTCK